MEYLKNDKKISKVLEKLSPVHEVGDLSPSNKAGKPPSFARNIEFTLSNSKANQASQGFRVKKTVNPMRFNKD